MKKNLKFYIATILICLTPLLGISQVTFQDTSWSDLLNTAKVEQKLIFVDLYFTGCFPCKLMDENVFTNEKVSNILNRDFVSFKSDILKEDIGKKISLKYGVTGFPTFVFLTADGIVLDITSGLYEVDDFTSLLNTVKENADKKIHKKYSNSLEGNYPKFYNDAYLKNKRDVSFEVLDSYLKNQQDLSAEIPFAIMTGLRVGGKYADYILNNAEQLAKDYSRMQMRNNLFTILKRKAMSLGKKNDQAAYNEVLEKAKPIFTKKEWTKFSESFQKDFDNNRIQ
ncbi:thioredoxin family protein [Flavivirga spongiicola]|uniref:DUF255 domain-containing protein n=1 Tax=Flavivirga spongiicola TaxID=421621 RepID=A0ABU7XQL5_9FLAO|nr:DUF255 domain-containing protein [Flavivirga sp. MEBiC05379]MDO5977846.1 DUF255 domain-containing protein [Flavivirga sp. MEBiC05379]